MQADWEQSTWQDSVWGGTGDPVAWGRNTGLGADCQRCWCTRQSASGRVLPPLPQSTALLLTPSPQGRPLGREQGDQGEADHWAWGGTQSSHSYSELGNLLNWPEAVDLPDEVREYSCTTLVWYRMRPVRELTVFVWNKNSRLRPPGQVRFHKACLEASEPDSLWLALPPPTFSLRSPHSWRPCSSSSLTPLVTTAA